jgi:glycogen debranching enzyme
MAIRLESVPPQRSGAEVDPLFPHHLVLHSGYTYVQSRTDGSVGEDPEEGLFDFDTRIVSYYQLTLDGEEPLGTGGPGLTSDRWQATMSVRRSGGTPDGPHLPQDALEVAVRRRVGLGMDEQLAVTNHSMTERATELAMVLGADFRDPSEIGEERRQQGSIDDAFERGTLTLRYRVTHDGRTLERGTRLRVLGGPAPRVERVREGVPGDEVRYRLIFPLVLGPRETTHVHVALDSLVDDTWRCPVDDLGRPNPEVARRERRSAAVRSERAVVESTSEFLPALVEQAADDLLALRNWDLEAPGEGWILNAGVPEYLGFFGRDSLAAGIQSAMVGTGALRGALLRAAATQGRRVDPVRDEEPGRIVHEMRRGPLAELGIRPHLRYYGSHTGPGAFVGALSEYWHWTGDLGLVEQLRPQAEAAMAWAAGFGDLDDDGLLEYQRRAPEGLENQGWKDSGEAIRYPDGRNVPTPIATVEEQAFHYLGLQRLAELLVGLGDASAAERYLAAAARVQQLVEARYWMEDEGFYALAIDGHGELVRTIASNPIHLLAAGMVEPSRASIVADRLLAPESFSGWGIRTLSKGHPSFNPFAYHLGAIWPVESAMFAQGAKRYGLDDHVERIATATFAAAGHCHRGRLPEVLAGHDRADTQLPVTYPGAKSPQAWSASATIFLVQSLLGLQPYAPARSLGLIRPHLPAWLPALTIRRLQVGDAQVDLRFERTEDGAADHEVLEIRGDLRVSTVAPPDDEAKGLFEHASRTIARVAPGRVARAGRIATGMEKGAVESAAADGAPTAQEVTSMATRGSRRRTP